MGSTMVDIINESLRTGIFPDNWKESMITPIEKIKKTKLCEEFRPINTLKTCEKILEKVVKEQLEQYMESNDLLSKYQSGFRKNFSCETAVNFIIDRWKKADKKKKIIALFLDFKRAFETIDRSILLRKLYKYGIQGIELKWFESYLTKRRQVTNVNNVKSGTIENECGVPQGSILGALLFIIYINDMPNIVHDCEMTLYADDTLIYIEGNTDEECYEKLNSEMAKVNEWLKMNKLKLNESKTKIMEIRTSSNIIFEINNEKIEKVNQMKYLGFIIDNKLNLRSHMDFICKKIGKKISFFRRLRKQISTMTAINIYNTIIKPHFEFGSTILYSCCTNQQIDRMQKLQNKAMRIILKCNRYTAINFMLESLRWLNIEQRLKLNTLNFIHKMKNGNAPQYILDQVMYVGESQPYRLRNNADFRIQRTTTTAMQRSLFYRGLQLFNRLPNDIKSEKSTNVFRKDAVFFVRNNLI